MVFKFYATYQQHERIRMCGKMQSFLPDHVHDSGDCSSDSRLLQNVGSTLGNTRTGKPLSQQLSVAKQRNVLREVRLAFVATLSNSGRGRWCQVDGRFFRWPLMTCLMKHEASNPIEHARRLQSSTEQTDENHTV